MNKGIIPYEGIPVEEATQDKVKKGDIYFAEIFGCEIIPTKVKQIDSNGFDYSNSFLELIKNKIRVSGHKFFDNMDGVIVQKNKNGIKVLTRNLDNCNINPDNLAKLLGEYNLL